MKVKKKDNYLDCYTCAFHSLLYDRHGRATGHWCAKRNGRLRKRFRGDCKYIKDGDTGRLRKGKADE